MQADEAPGLLPLPRQTVSPFNSGQYIYSSDPGVNLTDPLIGSPGQIKSRRLQKSAKKRLDTIARQNKEEEALLLALVEEEEAKEAARVERIRRSRLEKSLRGVRDLWESGISLGTFLTCILDPETKDDGDFKARRFREIFSDRSAIDQILGFWTTASKTPKQVRDHVDAWMVSHVSRLANREATKITKDGWMRTPTQVTKQGVLAFRLDSLQPRFAAAAPVMYQVVLSFATARRQAKSGSEKLRQRKGMVLTQAISSLLREHSRDNSLVATQNGLYLYAAGAKRQTIAVLSHAGWCCSYPRLVSKSKYPSKKGANKGQAASPNLANTQKDHRPESKESYRRSQHQQDAQTLAASRRYSSTYDNINFTDSIAERTIGRKARS
ncbi:hypothetical protein AURDEDRAFT_131505 [Auricularia subglabra TFB-10046 SS5]|uniref:Uncharacterized protein n=1 Tax=Auricularia subglabra (strain TFB-10046 / SS5) TaxID=717982 RepID=J0WN41_AURST|nr:hypothetical protein AURDEDRAFT_131505 [Auricularia subglabra TFB-10046 SS5]